MLRTGKQERLAHIARRFLMGIFVLFVLWAGLGVILALIFVPGCLAGKGVQSDSPEPKMESVNKPAVQSEYGDATSVIFNLQNTSFGLGGLALLLLLRSYRACRKGLERTCGAIEHVYPASSAQKLYIKDQSPKKPDAAEKAIRQTLKRLKTYKRGL